jgi:predicted alpha/beta superfamily hydrolase
MFASQNKISMKNKVFILPILCCLLLGLGSCKKDKLNRIGISEKFDITSNNTGTTYTMTVFYPDKEFPTTPVPVVYVMDGFSWSNMAAEVISDLSSNGQVPKCLMVSLDYKKGDGVYARNKDLVYSGEGVQEPAEADKFFQFLKTELLPQVEANYNCDTTHRVLFGHSLGGLFTLYSLLDNAANPPFKKYIAASCSIGMGSDNYVFQKESEVSNQISDLPVSLFIGSGTYVESSPAMHQEFYNQIKAKGYPNLKVGFGLYPEQHGTDAYPIFLNGIQFVFNN